MSTKEQNSGHVATSYLSKRQDTIKKSVPAEIEEEEHWDAFFAANKDHFDALATEALAQDRAGLTEDLDPEKW